MARRPFQRGIEIRHVDNAKSGKEFFCFSIRTVVNVSFSVGTETVVVFCGESSGAADKDASSLKGFAVSLPSSYGSGVIATVKVFL